MLENLFFLLCKGRFGADFGFLHVQARLRKFVAEVFELVRLRVTLENLPFENGAVVLRLRTVPLLTGCLNILLRLLLRCGVGIDGRRNLVLEIGQGVLRILQSLPGFIDFELLFIAVARPLETPVFAVRGLGVGNVVAGGADIRLVGADENRQFIHCDFQVLAAVVQTHLEVVYPEHEVVSFIFGDDFSGFDFLVFIDDFHEFGSPRSLHCEFVLGLRIDASGQHDAENELAFFRGVNAVRRLRIGLPVAGRLRKEPRTENKSGGCGEHENRHGEKNQLPLFRSVFHLRSAFGLPSSSLPVLKNCFQKPSLSASEERCG